MKFLTWMRFCPVLQWSRRTRQRCQSKYIAIHVRLMMYVSSVSMIIKTVHLLLQRNRIKYSSIKIVPYQPPQILYFRLNADSGGLWWNFDTILLIIFNFCCFATELLLMRICCWEQEKRELPRKSFTMHLLWMPLAAVDCRCEMPLSVLIISELPNMRRFLVC